MDNNNATKSYSIANVEEFKMEVISLLNKIRNQIEVSTSKTNIYDLTPNKKMAVNISVLKTHEFKLKELLEELETTNHANWVESQTDLIKDFEVAHQALNPAVQK